MNQATEDKLRKMDWVAYGLSVVVILLVILMRMPEKQNFGLDFSWLPPFYSSLNAIVAVCLIAALYFIKQKDVTKHKYSMITALALSSLFLLCYVVYHFTTPETKFCGEGNIRLIYFFLLITHIILAGVILPFILLTFNRGILMQIARHKAFARWVYPLWLYVAITGPLVYLMLKPCYQ